MQLKVVLLVHALALCGGLSGQPIFAHSFNFGMQVITSSVSQTAVC